MYRKARARGGAMQLAQGRGQSMVLAGNATAFSIGFVLSLARDGHLDDHRCERSDNGGHDESNPTAAAIIAAVVATFMALQALGGLRWPLKIGLAVAFGLGSYYLFDTLLGVPLPRGTWFR